MNPEDVVVVGMTEHDWPHVEAIYAAGISTGNATFETSVPSWQDFDASRHSEHSLVAVHVDGRVLGWAACSPVSQRDVYAGVVEHSVYVAPETQGQGVGRRLLKELIDSTEEAGIWMIQSSIFPENEPSLALHQRLGFRTVGRRERIAKAVAGPYADTWRDTILIERRSATAG